MEPRDQEVSQCADCPPVEAEVLIEDPALELAIQGEHLCKEGQWEAGIAYLEEALAASPADPVALSALYSQLGNAYFYVKRYDRALDVYSRDMANARRAGERREEAQAAANMTNTLRAMGSYQHAAEVGKLYLDMCRELKDMEGESRALYTLGSVFHALGKNMVEQSRREEESKVTLRKAVQYYREHLELVTKMGDLRGQGRVYASLGSVHCLQGEFQAAVQCYSKRLKAVAPLGDVPALRRTYVNLANTHLYLCQYSEAEQCYEQAMELSQQLKNKALEAQACFSLANTYSLAGDHVMATKYLHKHLCFAEELDDKFGAARACWCLGNAYTEMEEHKKAYLFACKHLELSMQLNDSAGVATAKKNLADLVVVMKCKDKKCASSEEKKRFFNALFGKRRGNATTADPPKPAGTRLTHRHSFDGGVNGRHSPSKIKKSSSGTDFLDEQTTFLAPKRNQVAPVSMSAGSKYVDCATKREEKMVQSEEQCSPAGEEGVCPASPSKPEEGKEAVDERLLDLIVECQGRRMDDQRSSVVPPVVEVTAPKVLAADRRSVSAPDSPRGEEEREQAVRERPNFVRANGGRRRSSNGSHGSLDDIFDTLMSAQNSRLEDQRSPDPFFERSQTLPGEDFLNLILQLQSRRMEDQRSPFPTPFF